MAVNGLIKSTNASSSSSSSSAHKFFLSVSAHASGFSRGPMVSQEKKKKKKDRVWKILEKMHDKIRFVQE